MAQFTAVWSDDRKKSSKRLSMDPTWLKRIKELQELHGELTREE